MPEHDLAFLRHVGYGPLGDNFMVYSGPCEPDTAVGLEGIVFFGDNLAGDTFGFDTRDGWQTVSVDHFTREVCPEDARTVEELIARRLAGLGAA